MPANYYDLVLLLIPVFLIGLSGGLMLFGVPSSIAVLAGALLPISLLGHAMFIRPPIETPPVHD